MTEATPAALAASEAPVEAPAAATPAAETGSNGKTKEDKPDESTTGSVATEESPSAANNEKDASDAPGEKPVEEAPASAPVVSASKRSRPPYKYDPKKITLRFLFSNRDGLTVTVECKPADTVSEVKGALLSVWPEGKKARNVRIK
jgi:hypothetical protein